MLESAPEIIYQCGPTLVVRKPAGLPTQAPAEFESMELRMKRYLAERQSLALAEVYLGVPHRLDRPVSGCLLFTLTRAAARKLSRQFERRQIGKLYWACVAGEVPEEQGTWTDSMRKVYGHPQAEIVDPAHSEAQTAVLNYQVLGRFAWGTWLEIELITGRTHQIRLQAASRGWPVLGDQLYGSTQAFGPVVEDPRAVAIALHGRSIKFRDPATGQIVCVRAPLDASWQALGLPLDTTEPPN